MNTQELQQLFAQSTPWGLTVGQTALVFAIVFAAGIAWFIVGFFLRIARSLMQIGCILIVLFACGCIGTMLLTNLARR